MRRIISLFCVLTLGILFSTAAFAQIDNLTNMSAEWIRMSNRNAAVDAADIVVYNPAGLTKLADGFHFNVSNQTLIRQPEHTFDLGFGLGVQTFGQDSIDAVVPNAYGAYKKDKWAVFAGVYIPAGGAVVDYPYGSISTKLIGLGVLSQVPGIFDIFINDYLKATSLYLTTTLGGAYAINDTLSLAAGVRYIKAKNTIKAGITLVSLLGIMPNTTLSLDAEDRADGFGGVFGLNISPKKGLNIGIHYETKIALEFETQVKVDTFGGIILVDGEKHNRDLPAMLGIGVSYDFTPKFRAELDFNYFFQKQANWGEVLTLTGLQEYSELAGDCYSLGAAFVYQATQKFQLSTGFLFTKFNFKDMDAYYTNLGAFEVLYSDNWNLAGGFYYEIMKNVRLNFGFSYVIWKDETLKLLAAYPLDIDVGVTNKSYALAVGLDISI